MLENILLKLYLKHIVSNIGGFVSEYSGVSWQGRLWEVELHNSIFLLNLLHWVVCDFPTFMPGIRRCLWWIWNSKHLLMENALNCCHVFIWWKYREPLSLNYLKKSELLHVYHSEELFALLRKKGCLKRGGNYIFICFILFYIHGTKKIILAPNNINVIIAVEKKSSMKPRSWQHS